MSIPTSSTLPDHGRPPDLGRRYRVEALLGRGGMGEVWRAYDRLTDQPVAIKRIRPVRLRHRGEALQETLRLTREFRLLSGLHHPTIISVSDYGLDRRGWPYFTMRLLDGAVPMPVAAAGRERIARVRLLYQLFDGLAYLHRRGVVHRDLKPSNVLVVGDRVHIVDFGLSIEAGEAGRVEGFAGTLQYLAPELLDGAQPSEHSDLYAAGLLAYEVLTGRPAFQAAERGALESAIRHELPDFADPRLGDGIAPLVRQLLSKHPAHRPQDHGAIIGLLAAVAGDPGPGPADAGTRDGLARAAPLVGRTEEFAELERDLLAAVGGAGGARLLFGAAGSGKSRLIEELMPLALVRGALCLVGRVPADIAPPFAPWRQALRPLIVECPPDDRCAALLRPLIPDIETLLDRPVPPPPELDPDGAVGRLAMVIAVLIRDLGRPVVLAIEDLQRAGPESLDLFTILADGAADLPLQLIGSARQDEARELAARTGVHTITELRPLGPAALATLAAAVVGPQGRVHEVVELLVRESEGNPFLAIELLHALVERAGGWDRMDALVLPERLLLGGMRAMAVRRLNRLVPDDRRAAACAAVAGGELDPELLRQVEPGVDWSGFLLRANAGGLIGIRGGRWMFIHEQLRSAVLAVVEPADRRGLHGRIARAIESVAAMPRTRAAELAWHWREAEDPAQEYRWSWIAGQVAVEAGAWRQAADRFERMIDLDRLHGGLAAPPADLPDLRFRAGEAAFRAGDLARALGHLGAIPGVGGEPLGGSTGARLAAGGFQILIQILHRLPGGSAVRLLAARDRRRAELLARTWELLARIAIYAGDGLGVVTCALRAANLGAQAATPVAFAQAVLGCAAGAAGRWTVAEDCFRRSRRQAAPLALVDTLVMEGVCHLGAAHFDLALQRLREAREVADTIGYRLGLGQALTIEGVIYGYAGDHVRMLSTYVDALACIRHHSIGHQPGFRCGQAKALIGLGRFTEARATLATARHQAAHDDRLSRSLISASLLLVHLREGELDAAGREEVLLDTLLDDFTAIPPPCAQLLEAPAELVIARWHAALQRGEPTVDLERLAGRRLRELGRWARIHPVGLPFAAWFRGHRRMLQGRRVDAWRCWERGCLDAARLNLPLYEGLLSLALAKHGPQPQQRGRRLRARALFARSRAMWHLRQIEDDVPDDDSGTGYLAWRADEGSGSRTAAYHLTRGRPGP